MKLVRNTQYWVDKLQLLPHPEGGYYKETYRSGEQIPQNGLPERFPGARNYSTAIYFLLENDNFSAFHRIKQDELWHFYEGNGLIVHVLSPDGKYYTLELGNSPEEGEQFQAVVPAGSWFASEVIGQEGYSLVGCTVAPGFDFQDFEMAKADSLINEFPDHEELIRRLCRQ